MYNYILCFGSCTLAFLLSVTPLFATDKTILSYISLALKQSGYAYDLNDDATVRALEVESAKHFFETQLIPLTTIGFSKGTGTQQIGLEAKKQLEAGSSITYGLVGNRVDEDSIYVVDESHNAKAYIRFSQGLFRRWGSRYNLADLNAAELRAREQEILAERGRQTLILETVRKYYNVVLATQLLEKSKHALERSRHHLRSAHAKQSVGLVSKADVYRADLATLDGESVVLIHQRQKSRAEDYLSELLRVESIEPLEFPAVIEKMVAVIPDAWEEKLFLTRLDWLAHNVKMETNSVEMFKVEQNLVPDIGVSFVVEQKGEGDNLDDALILDQTNWSLQLQMISSLDTFKERSALQLKRIEKAKLRRTSESLRRKIRREVDDAFFDVMAEDKNQQISVRRLRQAELALDLAKTRYEKGLSDNLAVIDAENSYSEAELGISKASISYNLAAVNLAYSLGLLDTNWVKLSLTQASEFKTTSMKDKQAEQWHRQVTLR